MRQRRALAGLTAVAVAAAGAGCGSVDRQPTTRGPADATFTVAASQRPENQEKVPCPPSGKPKLTATSRKVQVADVVEKRGAATRVLETANDLQLQCLKWSSWGGKKATARGVAHLLVCQPTCAEGTQQEIAATVVLTKPKSCGRTRWYAKATVTLDREGVKPPASYLRPPC